MIGVSLRKLGKIYRFLGVPRLNGPPIFLNSMPKAGTNLMENWLVSMGYKRNLSRCLNESNILRASLVPRRGHFYVGHLVDDRLVHAMGFCTIFLKRDLWSCLKSYVNYMYIDRGHPVSHFLRKSPKIDTIQMLLLTSDNPNGRPLLDEYLRFLSLNPESYALCIEFDDLIAQEFSVIENVARLVQIDETLADMRLKKVIAAESHTKNAGRIDLFGQFSLDDIIDLKNRVKLAEADAFKNN